MVWPAFIKLSSLLTKSEDEEIMQLEGTYSIVNSMKILGEIYMEKNKNDMEPEFEHKIMTVLTPSLKKLVFLDSMERSQFYQKIEDYIANEYPSQNVDESNRCDPLSNSQTPLSNSQPPVSDTTSKRDGFMNQFKCFDNSDCLENQNTELQKYLKHIVVRDVDPKIWWPENIKLYPTLFKIFLKLSPVPATSASSERSFSHAGNIITDKRSVILPDNVNNLVVARNSL